jgi:hypothetical protein
LVLIGADASGRKELLAVEDGFRESAQSWRELLLRLRDENRLTLGPELATGDGALGFWQALHEVWPKTRQQRCWVHKVANVLNKLPPSLQGKAKQDLHAIYEAESREAAEEAFDHFVTKYGAKYDKAVTCLTKDREALLTFYDFPAEHWKHVRTTNPIESTFATVRLRTAKTKGCLSRQTALAMVYRLAKSAERSWRRLDGSERLAQVIQGIRFRDGEPILTTEEQAAVLPHSRCRGCQSGRITSPVASCRSKHPVPQELEAGPAVHLPFDRLQPADLPLHRRGAPAQGQRGLYRRKIAPQAIGEALQRRRSRHGDPTVERLDIPLPHHGTELPDQLDDPGQHG